MSDKLNPPYNDLIGDILKEHTKQGGMDNLKGQGKPLSKEYLSGDTFQHFQRIAKDAGYKPIWLNLQHEIRDLLIEVVDKKQSLSGHVLDEHIAMINEKIKKHNDSCPPQLLKGYASRCNLTVALARWS